VPPRPDLIITGVEFNQAVQFFRSSTFLDPANVRPDNSIFLIARKNTGVRVYVDWDQTAGLPPISLLTGELLVSNGTTTMTLNPINFGITPKRDSNINQALANDTLNFMIPGALSAGTVTVTCRVFDQAAPLSKSAAFTRTLVFTPVEPLNLFLVGINTLNPAAAAPTQSAISNALSLLIQTYPRGDIQQTGYSTITLSDEIDGTAAPSSGCGDAWENLVDDLSDLRGDSTDVYFGGLPVGIACTGAVGGCSPRGDGVAASFIDVVQTVPHEVGHAMGRKHDPCRACSPAPQDADENYPQYGSFNSDSIGVFGFDATTNTVFDPASTLDFMSAFIGLACSGTTVISASTRWISPYTYQALLGSTVGGPSPGALRIRDARVELLFIGLSIARDRHVTRRPSFHFVAPLRGKGGGCESRFTYEFQDKDRAVLDCGPLHCRCTEGNCNCWPKTIRDSIFKPRDARWFVVWEGDKQLYEEQIPDPPEVRLVSAKPEDDGVVVTWDSTPSDGLWYVAHWHDSKRRTWRGVAPRLESKSLLIPRALFRTERELAIRVYATSGIATGYLEYGIRLGADGGQKPGRVTLSLGGVTSTTTGETAGRSSPCVLRLNATDPAGAQVGDEYIVWYDGSGNELAHGAQVDLRQLPFGRHVIRAVVRRYGGATVAKSWQIERTRTGCVVHNAICDPDPKGTPDEHVHPHPAPAPCDD
jgi:hypothetical protein